MKWLGIDAGRTGAVALLNDKTDEVLLEDTQTEHDGSLNCGWFFERLTEWEPDAAVMEQLFNRKSLMYMGGEFGACCKLFQLPLTHVAAKTWKKAVLGFSTDDKKVSIATCERLYSTVSLLRWTPKATKQVKNADRAEALLLAHWLMTTHR